MTTHRNYHISRPNIFVYFIVLCSPHIFHRTILSRTLLRMIGRNNKVKVEMVGINPKVMTVAEILKTEQHLQGEIAQGATKTRTVGSELSELDKEINL